MTPVGTNPSVEPDTCPACGYDRAGLRDPDAPCPECAFVLSRRLVHASPLWVANLRKGLTLLVWGIGIALSGAALAAVLPSTIQGWRANSPWVLFSALLLPILVAVAGAALLGECFADGPLRRRLRLASGAVVVCTCLVAAAAIERSAYPSGFGDALRAGGVWGVPMLHTVLLFLALGAILVWTIPARRLCADACATLDMPHAARFLRAGRLWWALALFLGFVALAFRFQMEVAIGAFRTPIGAPPPAIGWPGTGQTTFFSFAIELFGTLLYGAALVLAAGVWIVLLIARHRLGVLVGILRSDAQPTTRE